MTEMAKETNCRASSMDFGGKDVPPARILIGKVGLDGHDRGAKYVAHILRDAGFEVIYTGIRRTPEQIVATAIQEDVDIVGLSFLSGSHKSFFKRVIDLLEKNEASDIILVGGGIIPAADISSLREAGVRAVFTPGASAKEIVETFAALSEKHKGLR
jgi:methylmalonyl-CoA mutase C-terminal domain/subunit